MPIYEYKCDEGHTFEVMQSMSDDALDKCEVCGAPARRVLFAPAVHFKGSGFYTTDYARKGNGKAATGGESKAASSSSTGDEGGSGAGSGSSESKAGSSTSASSSGDA